MPGGSLNRFYANDNDYVIATFSCWIRNLPNPFLILAKSPLITAASMPNLNISRLPLRLELSRYLKLLQNWKAGGVKQEQRRPRTTNVVYFSGNANRSEELTLNDAVSSPTNAVPTRCPRWIGKPSENGIFPPEWSTYVHLAVVKGRLNLNIGLYLESSSILAYPN